MTTTQQTFGLWELTVTGPRAFLFEAGAPTVTVKGFDGDALDRANLEAKAADAVAAWFGRDYDDFPDSWCPLEFAEPVLTANKFRNPDDTQQWFVGVFEVGRGYGGPEEGGWWFDCGTLVQQTVVVSHAEAVALRDGWRGRFPAEDFVIRFSIEPHPEFFPETKPVYE